MRLNFDFASKDELDIIHNYSMKTLQEVGVRFCCDEAIQIFNDHGFKTDGDTVFMTEEQVWKALETCPKRYDWHGRRGHVTIGGGKTISAPTYGEIVVLEDGEYHTVDKRDFLNFVRLTATSPVLDVSNPNLVSCGFIDPAHASNWAQAMVLLHDEKPCGGMDQDCTVSMDKFIYDEEIILSCRRILEGIDVSEESMLYECVEEAGPGGNYLELDGDNLADSFGYYKDETLVLNAPSHKTRAGWVADGSESVTDRTKKIYTRRLEEYELPEVDSAQLDVLAKYVPEALLGLDELFGVKRAIAV